MKKIIIIFVVILSVLVVSCSSGGSRPQFNNDDDTTEGEGGTGTPESPDRFEGITVRKNTGESIVFSANTGQATTTFAIATTFTVTSFRNAFQSAADDAYGFNDGAVTITKFEAVPNGNLTAGDYTITYTYDDESPVYTLTVINPNELTMEDLTLTGVYTYELIKSIIRNGQNIASGGNVGYDGGGGTEGTIIAGTIHTLFVGDVFTPEEIVTYNQSGLPELFKINSQAKYDVSDFSPTFSADGRTLTLTANINPKNGYFFPNGIDNIGTFRINLRIGTAGGGSLTQDKWTR